MVSELVVCDVEAAEVLRLGCPTLQTLKCPDLIGRNDELELEEELESLKSLLLWRRERPERKWMESRWRISRRFTSFTRIAMGGGSNQKCWNVLEFLPGSCRWKGWKLLKLQRG